MVETMPSASSPMFRNNASSTAVWLASTGILPLSPASSNCLTKRSAARSEEHTSELQSRPHLVCRLLLEKKNHVAKIERPELPDAGKRRPTLLRITAGF